MSKMTETETDRTVSPEPVVLRGDPDEVAALTAKHAAVMKPDEYRFLGHRRWQDWLDKKTRPNVAMVGFAEGANEVPWKDESMEIWSCNDLPQRYEGMRSRFDRSFQFHSDHDRMRVAWPEWRDHLGWLRSPHDFPIYMQEKYANVPSCARFPKEQIEGMVPHGWYFAHSFCWMIAFAILLEFEEIHLYGVGSKYGEPISAMNCLHFWMGVAEGRGIKMVVHGKGEMFVIDQIVRSRKQYGYDLTRLELEHDGPDPMSGRFPRTEGSEWPELDDLQLYGVRSDMRLSPAGLRLKEDFELIASEIGVNDEVNEDLEQATEDRPPPPPPPPPENSKMSSLVSNAPPAQAPTDDAPSEFDGPDSAAEAGTTGSGDD